MYIHNLYPWIEKFWPLFWVQSAASWQGDGWNSVYCGNQAPKKHINIYIYSLLCMEGKLYSRQAGGSPSGSQQQPAIDSRWGCTAIKKDQAQIKPKYWCGSNRWPVDKLLISQTKKSGQTTQKEPGFPPTQKSGQPQHSQNSQAPSTEPL
jgi:hypothetical protein